MARFKCGKDLLEVSRRVLENYQAEEVKRGVLVDMQTANRVVRVYEALTGDRKAKFMDLSVEMLIDFVWKVV